MERNVEVLLITLIKSRKTTATEFLKKNAVSSVRTHTDVCRGKVSDR